MLKDKALSTAKQKPEEVLYRSQSVTLLQATGLVLGDQSTFFSHGRGLAVNRDIQVCATSRVWAASATF
jgi:hypothetical protein